MANVGRNAEGHIKNVFVISPIGKAGSDESQDSILFLQHIVRPVFEGLDGYATPVRSDADARPGSITKAMLQSIVNADLIIADLSGESPNPNVMYEVAIAHAADKPVILMSREPGGGPFDIRDERVIQYGFRVDEASAAKVKLERSVRASDPGTDMPNDLEEQLHPVREMFRQINARESLRSDNPAEHMLIELVDRFDQLVRTVEFRLDGYERDASINRRRYLGTPESERRGVRSDKELVNESLMLSRRLRELNDRDAENVARRLEHLAESLMQAPSDQRRYKLEAQLVDAQNLARGVLKSVDRP